MATERWYPKKPLPSSRPVPGARGSGVTLGLTRRGHRRLSWAVRRPRPQSRTRPSDRSRSSPRARARLRLRPHRLLLFAQREAPLRRERPPRGRGARVWMPHLTFQSAGRSPAHASWLTARPPAPSPGSPPLPKRGRAVSPEQGARLRLCSACEGQLGPRAGEVRRGPRPLTSERVSLGRRPGTRLRFSGGHIHALFSALF